MEKALQAVQLLFYLLGGLAVRVRSAFGRSCNAMT